MKTTKRTVRAAASRDLRGTVSVSATQAKNGFGRILDEAMRGGRVVITKHDTPKAMLMSIEGFQTLSSAPKLQIEALSGEFDRLLAKMQTPSARAAMRAAFRAAPAELGRAAVRAAHRRG